MFNFSVTKLGKSFDTQSIIYVWQKAIFATGHLPAEYRKDICGNLIRFNDYGNTNSIYGWEIDHILPINKGGTDNLSNLQPLQWQNNRRKGDQYPWLFM